MSPGSRSKSKKGSKEAQKASTKSPGPNNAAAGLPASAYNPLSGTFHTLEMSLASSTSPIPSNGRFRNIDETDDHPGGSTLSGAENDSVSNNGSCSGESDDRKEKGSNLPVGLETKERRAQELHERCSGYLMSRKLEALAQQLVAMGFSHEQATMALILNEGRVEESVAWLFEGGEEVDKQKDKQIGGSNLKIDISEELARIADMETRYCCSKQEVERAVVACEGDLDKATESLRELKQDPPSAPPKPEETWDPPILNNGKQLGVASQSARPQTKPSLTPNQLRKDEKDFNYTKSAVMVGGSLESSNKNIQPLKRIQSKAEWAKPQQATIATDKRWPIAASNLTVPYSSASPLYVSPTPAKTEARYVAAGGDLKNLLHGAAREPVVLMQRPQTANGKHVPATSMSSSPPGIAASWYPTNSAEVMRSNGFLSRPPSNRSPSPNYLSSNHMYHQLQYQPQHQFVTASNHSLDPQVTSRGNSLWNGTSTSPTLAAASSLGLFSGSGSAATSGSSSPVDWSTGGSMHFDYTSIDWSLDRGVSSPRSNALWLGLSAFTKNGHSHNHSHVYDSNTSGVVTQPSMRSVASNGGLVPMHGLQDGGVVASAETSSTGSREWSSPFEGKDLFSLPRQFVSSPL
ncbi:hypothetical protein K1719_014275 [Acacia pycnantha]|nr:hypothetical protein K1719_014275 [Acacia pycnantha]